MSKRRLQGALACYAVLALMALGLLEGPFLLVVLIFLAGLAVKSWVVYERERLE